jgi:hypothetical protein
MHSSITHAFMCTMYCLVKILQVDRLPIENKTKTVNFAHYISVKGVGLLGPCLVPCSGGQKRTDRGPGSDTPMFGRGVT